MKLSLLTWTAAAGIVKAAYPGDIVYYWHVHASLVDQSATFLNGTIVGGLQSPPAAWYQAIVQAAVYQAAVQSQHQSLEFQQLAVSHAAHNAALWVFHGTRIYNAVDASLRAIIPLIGLDPSSAQGKAAVAVGQGAAAKVAKARADDKIANFVDFHYGPNDPTVYQATPGGNPYPDTPQARYVTPFAGLGDISRFKPPPPLSISSKDYEAELLYVKAQGALNSTVRTPYDTDTAYFWREVSVTLWNRLAGAIVGNKLSTKVLDSAKFYAQLNYALANAAIAAWDAKYYYLTWRPVTAIQYPHVFLPSGHDVLDANWTPLLRPTPSHPDYVSTHSTFGGAASTVLRAFNGGSDSIDATVSSIVTLDNRGTITRRITNLTAAAEENAASRVFGGIHFTFAGAAGIALGQKVAQETLRRFDDHWDDF